MELQDPCRYCGKAEEVKDQGMCQYCLDVEEAEAVAAPEWQEIQDELNKEFDALYEQELCSWYAQAMKLPVQSPEKEPF